MAKKKDIEVAPSKYQIDIIDFIEHGVGNLVVEASAGCGKTTTLVMAINHIPSDKRILFCAFNNDIVKDIKKKTKDNDNVEVSTVHSLGLRILKNNFLDSEKLELNENKYRTFLLANINSLSTISTYSLGKKMFYRYINNILILSNLLRLNLSQTYKEGEDLAYKHAIPLIGDEIDVAFELIKWGKTNLDEIDYTDMIWLPLELYLKPLGCQYDFVFGDECQDFSSAQRELLLKCRKINTRFIFVGDENQCIYGFAGSDSESFNKLKSLPNTSTLPLPISYRCAKNIVKFAQNYVPRIEYNELDEREGEIKYNVSLDEVEDGDMVLCRNNAPLMALYNHFIKQGKTCYVIGKDIGKNLKSLLDMVDETELNVDLKRDGVFTKLYISLGKIVDQAMSLYKIDKQSAMKTPIVSSMIDKIHALEALSEGLRTKAELEKKIDEVFSDRKKNGISLSTIHKAKGLECNNVFIASSYLMNPKKYSQDWEQQQEKNLIYVAYTRAKNKLCFLTEDKSVDFEEMALSKLSDAKYSIRSSMFDLRSSGSSDYVGKVDTYTRKGTSIVVPKKGVVKILGSEKKKPFNSLGNAVSRKITKIKFS